jgi:hypothetical protein
LQPVQIIDGALRVRGGGENQPLVVAQPRDSGASQGLTRRGTPIKGSAGFESGRGSERCSGFLALLSQRPGAPAPVVPPDAASADRLRRHAQRSSPATHHRGRRAGRERAAELDRLLEILGQARRVVAAVAVVDAVLAGQAGEDDAERAQLGGNSCKDRRSFVHHEELSA